MSSIAKLLISFQCNVKIREGQAEETARGPRPGMTTKKQESAMQGAA